MTNPVGRPTTLTNQDRSAIVLRYVRGESTVALGEEYGVTRGSISYVLKLAGVQPRTRSEAQAVRRARSA